MVQTVSQQMIVIFNIKINKYTNLIKSLNLLRNYYHHVLLSQQILTNIKTNNYKNNKDREMEFIVDSTQMIKHI